MSELTKNQIKEIKIEQSKLDDEINKLSTIFEISEKSLIVQKNVALSKGAINNDFDKWKKEQKVVKQQLKKDVKTSVNNITKLVDESLKRTIIELNQLGEKISEKDIKQVGRAKIIQQANKAIRIMGNKILSDYEKQQSQVYKLKSVDNLYNAILKQTQEGIENGIAVAYKDGRKVSFKSYMEMNVRTTVRQEANKYLFNASKSNGVVFYVSDYYGDCAKDHEDYQSKYFYDEDWESFGYDEETSQRIKDFIDSYGMESYQSVVYGEPFLTTRPNCRHTLRPVVLDDALSKTDKQMTEEYNMRKGTYNDDNYKKLQEQRKNERMIRKYKSRLIEHQEQQKNLQNPNLKLKIKKDKELIKKWNEKQEKLLSENQQLKRDKRREDNRILVQDLGAGYHLGLKIDGKNMYVKEKIRQPLAVKDIASSGKIEIKAEKIIVKNDAFPDAFYKSNKAKKNIDILIKRINEQKNSNPEVVKMLDNLMKMESLEKNGIPFAVKFGKNNAVSISVRFTGEIVDSEIVLQDLIKNNTNGAFHTNLHELGHLIDLYNRNEKNQWFTENFENVKQILKDNEYKPLSNEIQTFFKETNEKYKQIKNEITKEYIILYDDLDKEYKEAKIGYFEWNKKWEKLLKEKNDKIDIERRNLGISGFEDIYDALSGGNLRENKTVTYGHGNRYYSNTNKRIEEIFANYVSLSITKPELVKMLENDKPELVDLLNNMIEKINEKVK